MASKQIARVNPVLAALKADPPARTKPRVTAEQDRPIMAFADWDRVAQVRSILVAFENSQGFLNAAIFADAMMRDDRVAGVVATRAGGLTASPIEFKPANGKRRAMKIAEELAGGEEGPGLWDEMCPASVVADMTTWGSMLGIAVAEIIWKTDNGRWVPRLKPWHPQFLRWDWKESRYYLSTMTGEVELPNVEEHPRSDGHWVVWCPHSYRNGWRKALLRPLSMLYLARQWAYRDWSRYNEKHGAPADKVYVPESANAQEKDEFYSAVANRGSDSTILLPRGENEAGGYDVQILEATARSWDSFEKQISKLETDIAVCVLGQNLTTEVQGGSFAAAKEHSSVRIDKKREDAAIAKVLRAQLLTWWAEYNYGDPELAPRPEYMVDPPEDDKAEAETLNVLGTALQSLQTASAPVDERAILEAYGVPLLAEEEIARDDEEEPGGPPQKTGEPDADDAPDKAKANLTAAQDLFAALERVASREATAKLRAPKKVVGRDRSARYADALMRAARARAAKVLRADLVALKSVVDKASSFEELRHRVVEHYKNRMNAKELAAVVEKVQIMAHLSGRWGALEQL
jgi:phage gp29-like protein